MAKCPFLRKSPTDDYVPVSETTTQFVERLLEQKNSIPKYVMQLMTVCPFRTASEIKKAYRSIVENGANFQISFYRFPFSGFQWAHTKNLEGNGIPVFPEEKIARSQDLEDVFMPTGSIWIANTEELLKSRSFYGPDYKMFNISWLNAIDIDTPEDWSLAEMMMDAIGKSQAG